MKFFLYMFFVLLIVLVFVFLVYFLSYNFNGMDHSKLSPFECGFQPFSGSLVLFSMPFFMISLMFLLFDVEILLICFFPFVFSMSMVGVFSLVTILVVFFATLYEWAKGILSWV